MGAALLRGLLVALIAAACGKGDTGAPSELARFASACKAASELVRHGGDDPAVVEAQVNRLAACADACDGNDAASCDELADQVARLCAEAAATCKALCDPAKPGSLSAAACKRAK